MLTPSIVAIVINMMCLLAVQGQDVTFSPTPATTTVSTNAPTKLPHTHRPTTFRTSKPSFAQTSAPSSPVSDAPTTTFAPTKAPKEHKSKNPTAAPTHRPIPDLHRGPEEFFLCNGGFVEVIYDRGEIFIENTWDEAPDCGRQSYTARRHSVGRIEDRHLYSTVDIHAASHHKRDPHERHEDYECEAENHMGACPIDKTCAFTIKSCARGFTPIELTLHATSISAHSEGVSLPEGGASSAGTAAGFLFLGVVALCGYFLYQRSKLNPAAPTPIVHHSFTSAPMRNGYTAIESAEVELK